MVEKFGVGQPVPRYEDPRLLTGGGRYMDDNQLPNETRAYILRSPYAHAKILSMDLSAARAAPGVIEILTGQDYIDDGHGELKCTPVQKQRDGSRMFEPENPPLVDKEVKMVGDYVALIVAESIDQAKDAAELIDVQYESLPSVSLPFAASQPGAPKVWAEHDSNVCFVHTVGDKGATEAAFENAATIAGGELPVNRSAHVTMEPRGAIGDYNQGSGMLTLYTGVHYPWQLRGELASKIFNMPETKVRVVAGDMGGSFGLRGGTYREHVLVCWATLRIGRPVKWVCERSEGFMSDHQGRDVYWNAEIAQNSANIDSAFSTTENRSTGILRNSINRQNTYGLISKLNVDINDNLEVQVGLDWRTAGIEHAREVRDLLGGDYYVDYADDFAPDGKVVKLGDIIAYHNETTVDWLGTFAQGKYTTDKFNVYGMGGLSTIKYSYLDHFGGEWSAFDGTGAPTYSKKGKVEADAITTFQLKGGAVYNLDDRMSAFVNGGYVQKPPILDNVISYDGTVSSDPDNEKFKSFEFGGKYNSDKVAVKLSQYNTKWIDRNITKNVSTGQGDSGDTDVIFLRGVQQNHSGWEVESKIAVHEMVDIDLAFSKGKWVFDGDAEGTYQEQEFNDNNEVIGVMTTEYAYGLDKLMVGDMPQTAYVGGLTLKPIKGLSLQGLYRMYDDNYADWSPDSREIVNGEADRAQVWKAPGYGRMDLHLSYALPKVAGLDMTVHAHVFNALDAVYVQDATDNSQYNGFGDKMHKAHNAEVFLGTPRYANVGISVNF